MTDKEKIIKAVKCRKNAHKRCGNPCELGYCAYAAWIRDPDGEPYYPSYCDVERLCEDVLFILQEQEPVKPQTVLHTGNREYPTIQALICGNCHKIMGVIAFNYCPWCGRKVKWEEK